MILFTLLCRSVFTFTLKSFFVFSSFFCILTMIPCEYFSKALYVCRCCCCAVFLRGMASMKRHVDQLISIYKPQTSFHFTPFINHTHFSFGGSHRRWSPVQLTLAGSEILYTLEGRQSVTGLTHRPTQPFKVQGKVSFLNLFIYSWIYSHSQSHLLAIKRCKLTSLHVFGQSKEAGEPSENIFREFLANCNCCWKISVRNL